MALQANNSYLILKIMALHLANRIVTDAMQISVVKSPQHLLVIKTLTSIMIVLEILQERVCNTSVN